MATPLNQVQQQFRQLFGRGPTAGDVGAFNEISARVANQGSNLPQQAVDQTQPTNQAAAGTGPNNIFDLAKSIGAPAVVSGDNVLSVNSKDFSNQPIVQQAPQVQSFEDALKAIQGAYNQELSPETINSIRSAVEAQFAPQFAEQQRVNDLRATLERAGAAQRGGVGFGGNVGRLNVGAQTQVAQAGADALNRLRSLQEAEIQARIQAAQTQDFEKQKTFIQQAQDLQQQQRQALQDYSNSQYQQQQLGLQQQKFGLDYAKQQQDLQKSLIDSAASGLVGIGTNGEISLPSMEELDQAAANIGLTGANKNLLLGAINSRIDELQKMDLDQRLKESQIATSQFNLEKGQLFLPGDLQQQGLQLDALQQQNLLRQYDLSAAPETLKQAELKTLIMQGDINAQEVNLALKSQELAKMLSGAEGQQFADLDNDLQKEVMAVSNIDATLQQLKDLSEQVKTSPGLLGRAFGGQALLESKFGLNPDVKRLNDFKEANLGLIARVISREVGVLTDQDVQRARNILPSATDTTTERENKFLDLQRAIDDKKKSLKQFGVSDSLLNSVKNSSVDITNQPVPPPKNDAEAAFDSWFQQYQSGFNQPLSMGENGLDQLKQSLIKQESGGNYKAIGEVPKGYSEADKALGKYQIVPKFHFDKIGLPNTPEGRQKFLNSPQLQDQLFGMIIDGLSSQYNGDPAKIAAAYYGGSGGAKVVGTPAGDKPQYAGGKKYPSINQYVNSVLSRINNIG